MVSRMANLGTTKEQFNVVTAKCKDNNSRSSDENSVLETVPQGIKSEGSEHRGKSTQVQERPMERRRLTKTCACLPTMKKTLLQKTLPVARPSCAKWSGSRKGLQLQH